MSVAARESVFGSPVNSSWFWRWLGMGQGNQPGRYTLLLLAILMLLIGESFFVRHSLAQALTLVTMSFVLLSALSTLNVSKTYFVLGILLALPALISRWILQFEQNEPAEVIVAVTASAFIMITVMGLIRHLFKVRQVTFDTISAAICAYLLLALAWAFIFALLELEEPGSFSSSLVVRHVHSGSALLMTMNNAIYYSFVCLTTTGYGDIAPRSELTRTLSVLESVTRQMYLAILIARLVSLQVAQSIISKP
jgi:voltage-gated potassium channel